MAKQLSPLWSFSACNLMRHSTLLVLSGAPKMPHWYIKSPRGNKAGERQKNGPNSQRYSPHSIRLAALESASSAVDGIDQSRWQKECRRLTHSLTHCSELLAAGCCEAGWVIIARATHQAHTHDEHTAEKFVRHILRLFTLRSELLQQRPSCFSNLLLLRALAALWFTARLMAVTETTRILLARRLVTEWASEQAN